MRIRRWLIRLAVLALLVPALTLMDRVRERHGSHQAESLSAGGIAWRVLRAGPSSGDTTLVLIHGFGDHLLGWRAVLDGLAERHRVVAFDLPGFGVTDKPDTVYTLEAMVGWVTAFLDTHTSGTLVLIGHSMGGEIAAATALARPERVGALVLIAPAGLDVGLGQIGSKVGERGQRAIGWWESARSWVTPLHDPAWLEEPPELREYNQVGDPAYIRSTARVIRDFDFGGLSERFGEVRQPTLLIWGRLDPVLPIEAGRRIASLLPCRRLEVLPTLHRPQVERPDTTLALILGFLEGPACARESAEQSAPGGGP